MLRGLAIACSFPCKTATLSVWACLDSNQGPLPYQRGYLTTAWCRHVRKPCLDKRFSPFSKESLVRRVSLHIVSVGVGVGVKTTGDASAEIVVAKAPTMAVASPPWLKGEQPANTSPGVGNYYSPLSERHLTVNLTTLAVGAGTCAA
jgi:hypothetical protein